LKILSAGRGKQSTNRIAVRTSDSINWCWCALAHRRHSYLCGIFSPENLEHMKKGDLAAFGKSVDGEGWFYVIGTLVAGILWGLRMKRGKTTAGSVK